MTSGRVHLADSVTVLGPSAVGAVVVTGSHGGRYAAGLVLRSGAGAAVFNDAGVGLRGAGIAGLAYLAAHSIPAAAVLHTSARIGRADDTLRGVVGHLNGPAVASGVRVGMRGATAAELLATANVAPVVAETAPGAEERVLLVAGDPEIWALDSAGLIGPDDVGRIVFTGSHGGLVGGRVAAAAKADVMAAVFNDAGIGLARAGLARLPPLARRGIAAATVAAGSAEIGSGISTYRDGTISAINTIARSMGGRIGMSAAELGFVLRGAGRMRGLAPATR